MGAEADGEQSKQQDLFYSSLQDEMNYEEVNRMNIETEGFWGVDNE